MKHALFLVLSLLMAAFGSAQTLDRQVIGTTGGSATSSGVTLDYTVGEVVTATAVSGTLILTQGFQQPSTQAPSSAPPVAISLNYSLYPNPTNNWINFDLQTEVPLLFGLRLVDALGRFVSDQAPTPLPAGQHTFRFDLRPLPAGTYFLQLYTPDGQWTSTLHFSHTP
jgi:hypothetical protein